ncbi:SDR family oxidoreductase [Sporichthya polymorpha]|uniref:SDR family oxidoreductase n=1 Tax=Sporichthya polymorpha TaxID=35751 RepID=UPI0003647B68|nr:SDR family oxidoreductase [Sporichthya polymorpha]
MTTAQGELQDKVAVITGAARGIGAAIAEAYDKEGAIVVVSDIDGEGAERVAKGLSRGSAIQCDVTDEASVQALFDGAVAQHGRVDIAVANAGVGRPMALAEMNLAEWRKVTSVNLDGVFLTIRSAALAMAATGGGSIIGMASITGFKGSALIGDYAAAKAGVINLCKTAATEFRAHNVRVNAMCPTFLDTVLVQEAVPTFEAALGVPFDQIISQKQGRMGQVSDVTPLAVFLASERSRFSTGSAFVVDHGWLASLV